MFPIPLSGYALRGGMSRVKRGGAAVGKGAGWGGLKGRGSGVSVPKRLVASTS